MDPTQFKTKEEWFEFVKEEWKKTFEKLEKNKKGEEFFGSIPGIDKKDLVDEPLPAERRKTAIIYTSCIFALLASIIGLICYFH